MRILIFKKYRVQIAKYFNKKYSYIQKFNFLKNNKMAFRDYVTRLGDIVQAMLDAEPPSIAADSPVHEKVDAIIYHIASSDVEAARSVYNSIIPKPQSIVDYRIGHLIAYNNLTELVEPFSKFMFAEDRDTGFLPLHLAVYLGDIETVKKIVDCRFNLDMSSPERILARRFFDHRCNDDGLSVFEIALLHNQADIVAFLVFRSVKRDVIPFHIMSVPAAIKLVSLNYGDVTEEIFERLKELGVDFNQNLYGMTFLHLAARHGSRRIVLALLAVGADPKLRKAGDTLPVETAVFAGNYSVVLDLFKTPVHEFSNYVAVYALLQGAGQDAILRAFCRGPE